MTEDVDRGIPRIPTGWEQEYLFDPPDRADSLDVLDVDLEEGDVDWRSLAISSTAEREILRERVAGLEERCRDLERMLDRARR